MKPRITDRKLLRQEIIKLEKATIAISSSLLLATCEKPTHHESYWKVWNAVKIQLNSAKLEYECTYGNGNWLLDNAGFRRVNH